MEILTYGQVYSCSAKGEKKLLITRNSKTGDVNISPFMNDKIDDFTAAQMINVSLSAQEAEELKKFLNENT